MIKYFEIPEILKKEAEELGCLFCEGNENLNVLIQENVPGGNRGYAHKECLDNYLGEDEDEG